MSNNSKKKQQLEQLREENKKLKKSISPFVKYLLAGSLIGAISVNFQPFLGIVFPITGGILGSHKDKKKNERIKGLQKDIKKLETEISKEENKENNNPQQNITYTINNQDYSKEEIEKKISNIENNPFRLDQKNLTNSQPIKTYEL